MFLFLRLLLAHFIGDFPLQFDAIYRSKLKGLQGTIPHALIIFLCFVALSWPYLHMPKMWFFIIFLSANHLTQDTLKIKMGTSQIFWGYFLDQLFHVGLIACVFLTSFKTIQLPAHPSNIFERIYCSDAVVIYLIALIAASYNGYFLIRCFKDAYIGRAHYNPCEKWYGMAERGLIVSFFFLPATALLLLPVLALFRPLIVTVVGKRCGLTREFSSLREAALSWTVALLTGLTILYFRPFTL
jgi:hypothetical protein